MVVTNSLVAAKLVDPVDVLGALVNHLVNVRSNADHVVVAESTAVADGDAESSAFADADAESSAVVDADAVEVDGVLGSGGQSDVHAPTHD